MLWHQQMRQQMCFSSVDRGARRVQQQKMAFDEMANMLRNVAGDIHPNEQQRSRKHDRELNTLPSFLYALFLIIDWHS